MTSLDIHGRGHTYFRFQNVTERRQKQWRGCRTENDERESGGDKTLVRSLLQRTESRNRVRGQRVYRVRKWRKSRKEFIPLTRNYFCYNPVRLKILGICYFQVSFLTESSVVLLLLTNVITGYDVHINAILLLWHLPIIVGIKSYPTLSSLFDGEGSSVSVIEDLGPSRPKWSQNTGVLFIRTKRYNFK